MNCIIRFVICF